MKAKAISKLLIATLSIGFFANSTQSLVLAHTNEEENLKVVTEPFGATPTKDQVDYQREELTAFIHFGINTFTGREWGDGNENPELFNPTELDANQWVKTLADAGFQRVILTAKHHDGFNLWDTAYSEHDVASSPWKDGKGDVVREVSEACEKYGVKFGVYLSPWDQNSEHYGEGNGGDYNEFYMNQLRELLTNYGTIAEVWMDGAKGSNVQQEYKFDEWFSLIKELQPECEIFSPQGPDIRWIGNENGYAGEPCWSTIDVEKMKEKENPSYLNTGEEGGPNWIVGESDVSIRPGWFYHSNQDNDVKSLEKLMDIYFKSVGRNSVLLLNLPPDKRGKLHENDVKRMEEFGEAIRETFNEDLALNKDITTDSRVNDLEQFDGNKIIDNNYDTYWAPNNGATTGSFEINLGEEKEFDVINIQEYIPLGQRVAQFNVEVEKNGEWKEVFKGKTIGHKRLVRIAPTKAQKIRINIDRAVATPLINNVGVYKQPTNIELPAGPPDGLNFLNDNKGTDLGQFNFSSGWNYETINGENDFGGDAHWTSQVGATVKIKFKGTKFFLTGTKDPSHGIMEVSIDGKESNDIDLYNSTRTSKQIVFESEDLTDEEHEITIKCSGRKNPSAGGVAAHLDGAFVLDNGGKGMLDIENVEYTVNENIGTATLKVIRKGGTNGRVEVNYETLPGTALNAEDYQTWSGTLAFNEGEKEKEINVTIIDDKKLEETEYFYLKLSDALGGAILGFNTQSKINIEDDELIKIETNNKGTELHKFNFSNGWNDEEGGVWTKQKDASFTINFEGSKISLVGAKDPNHGIYQVSIDDEEFIDIDPYAENRQPNQVVFESERLSYGNHTLTFKVKGENPHGGRTDAQINYALIDRSESEVSIEPSVDINKDGVVNVGDLAIVSKYFGENKPEYDLNKDGIIDEYELNTVIQEIIK